jgi:hypothetical protein
MTSLDSETNSGERSSARLVGWLVSYGIDSLGAAYEIRAGRLLISSAPASDLRTISVADDSVSSPHLAVNATAKHQVLIQDIFSEHGTYIRKLGAEKEQRVTGPTPLHHGDWLRIGDTMRFQVCLIDMGKHRVEQ